MNQLQRIILYVLVLVAGAAWIALSADSDAATNEATSAPQAGFTALDFTLETPSGETYTLSSLQGSAVLVNFWATWCPPCREEMPAIQKLYEEYKDRGFIVLAVNSTIQDNPAEIPAFIEEYSLAFPILLDKSGEATRAYQIRSLPSSFFINRLGVITEVVIGGPMSEALLRTRIEEALK